MTRKFFPFDDAVIRKEFLDLPRESARDLKWAMENYQSGRDVNYTIKNYGGDLLMIKGRGQGRCLFFSREVVDDVEQLIVFLIYKKESQEVPDRVLRTARERMARLKEQS